MIDYAAILARKFKDSEWTLEGDQYTGLKWLSDTPKPTKKTLDDLWPEVQAMIQAEKDAKAAAELSAVSKLTALGLTTDEIAALRK